MCTLFNMTSHYTSVKQILYSNKKSFISSTRNTIIEYQTLPSEVTIIRHKTLVIRRLNKHQLQKACGYKKKP